MPSNSNPKYLTTPSNFQFNQPPPPPPPNPPTLPLELQKAIRGMVRIAFGITHFAEVIHTFLNFIFSFAIASLVQNSSNP